MFLTECFRIGFLNTLILLHKVFSITTMIYMLHSSKSSFSLSTHKPRSPRNILIFTPLEALLSICLNFYEFLILVRFHHKFHKTFPLNFYCGNINQPNRFCCVFCLFSSIIFLLFPNLVSFIISIKDV